MKYHIHIGFLLLVVCGATTVWANANAVLLAPRSFSEYFTDNLNEDTRESSLDQSCAELGCARSHGWGKGYVTHARVGFAVREGNYNRMPQAKPPAPAPLAGAQFRLLLHQGPHQRCLRLDAPQARAAPAVRGAFTAA